MPVVAAIPLWMIGVGGLGAVALVVFLLLMLRKPPPTPAEVARRLANEHKIQEAARVLIEAGQHAQAIDLYLQHRRLREAAKLYLHTGDHKKAAELFSSVKDYDAAANSLLKANDIAGAAAEYEKGGFNEKAAGIYVQAGKLPDAARAYLAARQLQNAAAVYVEMGEKKKAAAIMGAWYSTLGDFVNAGKNYFVAGKMKEAAESFMRGGLPDKAAQIYERVGEFREAAKARLQAGDIDIAAEHLERVGDLHEAIKLFEAGGKWNKVVECYKREKNWLALGNIMMRLEKYDLALEFFKRLTPLDEGYNEAAMSTASILEGQGDLDGAMRKYCELLEFKGLNVGNAPALFALCTLCEKSNNAALALQFLRQFRASGPVGEKAKNWESRLEQMVISAAQTMAVGLEVANEDEVKHSAKVDVGLPQRASIADRYETVDKIGQGGHGVIYKAFDKILGREVVLKFLFRNQVPSDMARRYFLREAKTTASLNHPNIVTLYDMGQVGDNLYIAMEFIDGVTLEQLMRDANDQLPFETSLRLISQLCDALQYAHDKSIIHRDIKPGNVMLTGSAKDLVKLMDFGLAKALDENPHKTLIICGTPLYMSPEQIVGDFVDHLSDIYSLGIMVFQMLAGRTPFPAANILAHHQFTQPPHPTTINKAIPLPVGDVILQCIAKKREERYSSARKFADDLQQAFSTAGKAAPAGSSDFELEQ